MNKFRNEWMNEWMNECMVNEWRKEWMNEWMNQWINLEMNEWMNEWIICLNRHLPFVASMIIDFIIKNFVFFLSWFVIYNSQLYTGHGAKNTSLQK